MIDLLIHNAQVMAPQGVLERGWLWTQGPYIAAIGTGKPPATAGAKVMDAGGLMLLPGFIDVHVHGAANYDTMDASTEALRAMATFYARHGVTAFLATTWTDTRERILAALTAVKEAMALPPWWGAALLGVHLEGPYLNAEKCGAQNISLIRRAEPEEATAFLESGVVRLVSLAPEFTENEWLITACVERGITVSLAHTAATFDEAARAIELGISHATHTFNAMPPLHHRNPGALGAALIAPQVACELIADNIHVHPGAMRMLWELKKMNHLVLVTDAIRATGQPDGAYPVDERTILVENGVARLSDGTLAGSTLTMNRALRNFTAAAGQPLEVTWPCASLNPARAIGEENRRGTLAVGKLADLVLVDAAFDAQLTVVMGKIVYT